MRSEWVIFRDFMGLEYLLNESLQLFQANKTTIDKMLKIKQLYLQKWSLLEKELIRKVSAIEVNKFAKHYFGAGNSKGNFWKYIKIYQNVLAMK